MNEAAMQNTKIARTLLNATITGNEDGVMTADDTTMMLRGALRDVGYALAVLLGAPATTGTQIDVGTATEAAVKAVVEVTTKKGVAA